MIFIFTTRCWKWWGQQSLLLFSISILCFIFLKGWRHHQVLLLSGQGRHRVFLDIYHHLSVKLGHRSFENFMNFSDVNKFMKNFGSKFSTLELRSLELVYRWDLPKMMWLFVKKPKHRGIILCHKVAETISISHFNLKHWEWTETERVSSNWGQTHFQRGYWSHLIIAN